MKKLISKITLIVLTLSLLASCAATEPSTGKGDSTAPISSSEKLEDLVITSETELKIAYAENASEAYSAAADKLFNAIFSKTGIRSFTGSDEKESEVEILLGNTARTPEGLDKDLLIMDYLVKVDKNKVYILAGSDAALERAVSDFSENHIVRGEKSITLKGDLSYVGEYDYPLDIPSINGVSLKDYSVFVNEDCDKFTLYAAQNLVDYLKLNMGFAPELIKGERAEANSIVIGAESGIDFKENGYTLYTEDSKILIDAEGYMIGAGVGELINNYIEKHAVKENADITDLPKTAAELEFSFLPTENAVLLVGDGMGKNHINAALQFDLESFAAHSIPNRTDCTTYSASVTNGSAEFTDSAAAATALSTGTKTINGYIGLDENLNELTNAREYAQMAGANTAILTTDAITGATPAGFLAHAGDRNSTGAIQSQIDKLVKDGKVNAALGSLDDALLDTSAHHLHAISAGDSDFFAMIEEGYIDKHSHNNNYDGAIDAVVRFNDVIAYAMEFVLIYPDTALIVTADHETGGLTYDEVSHSYNFTSTNHTNADVDLFMLGYDAEELTSDLADNTEIGNYLCELYK